MLDTETTGADTAPKKSIPVWSWRNAIQKASVPPLTKLICYEISNWLSDCGKGWRVRSTDIQQNTGLSNRSVATHLATAEKAKLLTIVRELGPNGQRGVTKYIPCFPPEMELAREAEIADAPSEPNSCGEPREPGSLRTAPPREPPSPSHVKEVHDKYLSNNKTTHQKEDLHQGAAQARPLPEVEPIEAVQPKPKKARPPKQLTLDGEPVRIKTPRTTKVPFPDDAEQAERWVEFGVSTCGMTEAYARADVVDIALHFKGEGTPKADWDSVVKKCLLRKAPGNPKNATNGTGRSHQPSWHDLADHVHNRRGEVVF